MGGSLPSRNPISGHPFLQEACCLKLPTAPQRTGCVRDRPASARLLGRRRARRWGTPAFLKGTEDFQAVAGQDDQSDLGSCSFPAEAAKHTQAAVLLQI